MIIRPYWWLGVTRQLLEHGQALRRIEYVRLVPVDNIRPVTEFIHRSNQAGPVQ